MRVPFAAARLARRRSPLAQRRFASTLPEGGVEKAKDALASAQKQAQKAWQTASEYAGPVGDRLGSLLGSYRAPVTYNLAVAKELFKHIYIAERLQPPSFAEFQSVYTQIAQRITSPTYLRELVNNGDVLRFGVYGLEAYGIFKIGEIIGRRSLVGYNVQ